MISSGKVAVCVIVTTMFGNKARICLLYTGVGSNLFLFFSAGPVVQKLL